MNRSEKQARRERDWLIDRELLMEESRVGHWTLIVAFLIVMLAGLIGEK